MNDLKPLTKEQLHEIAVRRRGDADVKALLLEIKRLHGVLVQAYELAARFLARTPSTVITRTRDWSSCSPKSRQLTKRIRPRSKRSIRRG